MDTPNTGPTPEIPAENDELDQLAINAARGLVDTTALTFSSPDSGFVDTWQKEPTDPDITEVSGHEVTILRSENTSLITERDNILAEKQIDYLTKLKTRKALEEDYAALVRSNIPDLRRSADQKASGHILLLVDADHFSAVNLIYGHSGGDKLLRQIAAGMRVNVRSNDLVGRWAGDEFLIILPRTDEETGLEVAERIRSSIAGLPPIKPLKPTKERPTHPTVSIGVAEVDPNLSLEANFDIVDQAMFKAKELGRNQVVLASEVIDDVSLNDQA